jgi:hypothetical protein
MINVEYIIDGIKSLLTIRFNNYVLKHMKAKCDDYVNFYQATHNNTSFTMFKSDTGYRITRVPKKRKQYQICVRHLIPDMKEFESIDCTYYLKRNGFVRFIVKQY